ncbi:MAG: ISAs1 family transposase [Pseudonocardiales bacterium]|nr:ISAs1 family transposase [Pseudonocardiales bacterium]
MSGDPCAPEVMCPELLARFAEVSDGRRGQGRVHPVAVVLALCAAAVVAGMGSFTAIAGWAGDVPAGLLAQLYGRPAAPPSKATIWRVLTGADAAAVDAVIGAGLAGQASEGESIASGSEDESLGLAGIAVEGKTVRGATDTEGNQVHLLAAATHRDGLVLGQVEVGVKTNEIPMFAPLLDQLAGAGIDLSRAVITADALHTQRAHAEYLHERGAGFVFTVKENQPGLFAALDALPWPEVPIAHRDIDTSHTPHHHPHHPGPPRPHRPALPPRQPGLADRALHPRPHRQTTLRGRGTGHHQPARPPRHPGMPGHPQPPTLGHRVAALAPRHPLPRRPLHRPHPFRTTRHGRPAQPRHRSHPAHRPTRHHRSNPRGSPRHAPPLQDPQTHIMILKQPCAVGDPRFPGQWA